MTAVRGDRRTELLARFGAAPDRIASVASAISGADTPPPGEWSAREVVLHLVAVEEEVWQARLEALARDESPRWSWTEPGLWHGPGEETLDRALAVFRARRLKTARRLEALDVAQWAHTGTHATYGLVDMARLVEIAIDHDEEHIAQIAALDGRPA